MQNRQKEKKYFFPGTLKAPISNNNPNKIKLRMLQVGLKCKQLEEKIQSIERELKINNHKVDNRLNEDFIEIISSNSRENDSLYEAFWEQQKHLFTAPSWVRYRTVIICFCLHVAAKSPSV